MATVCQWFDLKTTRTVSDGLTSKPVAMVSSGLASKHAATASYGLASKPTFVVFNVLDTSGLIVIYLFILTYIYDPRGMWLIVTS
jgi:hypothetical protein